MTDPKDGTPVDAEAASAAVQQGDTEAASAAVQQSDTETGVDGD